jgi:hypothetical protein
MSWISNLLYRLAYSCMMMMALGFNNTMYNTTKPINEALLDLASGNLGRYMTPMAFNTSYIGPQGPMQIDSNGDVITGYVCSDSSDDLNTDLNRSFSIAEIF